MTLLAKILWLVVALSSGAPLAAQTGVPIETIELSTLDWPPYIGAELPDHGHIYQIVEQAFSRQNIAIKVQFLPWARAMEVARNGQVAGVFPEYHEARRKQDFAFSDPLPGGPIGFYKRRDHALAFSADPRSDPGSVLQALRDQRFGVVRGYVNSQAFDDADYLLKEEANSDEINLKKLGHGRVDLIVIDRYVARHLLATRLPQLAGQLEFMEPPLEYKPLYLAFSKQHPNWQRYLSAFNTALAAMREDGSLQAILRDNQISPGP